MLRVREGHAKDAEQLAHLIFASAPVLLPYLFGSKDQALTYLTSACTLDEGQYSARRHLIVEADGKAVACMALWHSDMPTSFQAASLRSVAKILPAPQLKHLLTVNQAMLQTFIPPKQNELCIGHLSVHASWQRQKLGNELLSYATSFAQDYKKSVLVLDVDADNHIALAFYQSLGFEQQHDAVFEQTKQTFVRMAKQLV